MSERSSIEWTEATWIRQPAATGCPPDATTAEVHQQLGRRPLLRPLACEHLHQPALRQDEPARVQEQEQRLPYRPLDDLVKDAVDFTAVGMRPHATGLVLLDHLMQPVVHFAWASEKKQSSVSPFFERKSEATRRAISPEAG
ncbi:hypothetical protein [Streptomyces sp. ALB3]|uniref:hypothetical protein n=1 Tax=Streptomyces sp. ALB3 TaxID=3374278 RepID=UPI0037BA5EA3